MHLQDNKEAGIIWHLGKAANSPIMAMAGSSPEDRLKWKIEEYEQKLKKALIKFYDKKIRRRMFWFHKAPAWLFGRKEFDFEYTLTATWSQLEEKWQHSGDKRRGPDWRISLPWKKKTRGFPEFTQYLKGSIELRLGVELAQLAIDVLDGLMYDMKETSFDIRMINNEPKVHISVVERVRKIEKLAVNESNKPRWQIEKELKLKQMAR